MSARPEDSSIPHGDMQLAVRSWNPAGTRPVIALHGWLDNAASFDLLAPRLPDCRVIALDMPGHGLSTWRHREAGYYIWSYVEDVLAVADALQLQTFSLLGHSMGGAVACLLASLCPERIEKLMLLDAVGPLSTSAAAAPDQMRRALLQQQGLKTARRNHYPTLDAAVQARAAKGVSDDAARLLGERGIASDAEGFYWALDPRLSRANMLSLSEEQVEVFIRLIACPVRVVSAPAYWQDHDRRSWFDRRCSYFRHLDLHELPGSHHQHLDGQVEEVAALCREFLTAPV